MAQGCEGDPLQTADDRRLPDIPVGLGLEGEVFGAQVWASRDRGPGSGWVQQRSTVSDVQSFNN